MLIRIIQNKKARLIALSLFVITVLLLIWRDYSGRMQIKQEYERFLETKNFTSAEFVLFSKGVSLDKRNLSVDVLDRLWTIIKEAKTGSGHRKEFEILLILYFARPNDTTVTISFRKDYNAEQVRISFNLPEKAGYSLISEDRHNLIDKLVVDSLHGLRTR